MKRRDRSAGTIVLQVCEVCGYTMKLVLYLPWIDHGVSCVCFPAGDDADGREWDADRSYCWIASGAHGGITSLSRIFYCNLHPSALFSGRASFSFSFIAALFVKGCRCHRAQWKTQVSSMDKLYERVALTVLFMIIFSCIFL